MSSSASASVLPLAVKGAASTRRRSARRALLNCWRERVPTYYNKHQILNSRVAVSKQRRRQLKEARRSLASHWLEQSKGFGCAPCPHHRPGPSHSHQSLSARRLHCRPPPSLFPPPPPPLPPYLLFCSLYLVYRPLLIPSPATTSVGRVLRVRTHADDSLSPVELL
ncbi:uncharacterized protein EI97DRAFT_256770 [Westerdykella ornata]|uniref:Uncharacterized protein n=1 Tax=Westerdykella ornata TaxID=318751 RepID=A0A6A6JRL0_WESOR|nr:uncharacterized protein EI97DRAFT_256770 [Westerdykella ornata]KAF2278508.1 hypothetical protein EI97DRAFT_256770 [Westerdykella ornata]